MERGAGQVCVCREAGGLARAGDGGGQPRTFRLLVEHVSRADGDGGGELPAEPARQGVGREETRRGPGDADRVGEGMDEVDDPAVVDRRFTRRVGNHRQFGTTFPQAVRAGRGQDAALVQALGKALPAEARLGMEFTGAPRLIVPTVRGMLREGETLRLTVIVLDNRLPKEAALHYRPLGSGEWKVVPLRHVGRAVHAVEVPAVKRSLEYHITATTAAGQPLVWPATAPELCQTVVIMDE